MENDVKPINNEETENRIKKFFNEADVKLRGQRGIIVNCLKSDAEAANLWNGMSRAVKLNEVSLFDKVVADLNKYYNGRHCAKHLFFCPGVISQAAATSDPAES
ncbi:hypothetical protein ACET3Z_013909 [Daucus carota]